MNFNIKLKLIIRKVYHLNFQLSSEIIIRIPAKSTEIPAIR